MILTSLALLSACVTQDPAMKDLDAFIAKQTIDKTSNSWKSHLPKPPQVKFTEGTRYLWQLKTNKGDILIKFMPSVAPMHVSSTIYLTKLGFYDNLIFHRVIPGFMAQGGDPLGKGSGDPGYFYQGEFDTSVKHDKPGLLSMANRGPGTDGSQFFITFTPTPHLNGRHTIFGEVVEGQETLKALEKEGTSRGRTKVKLEIIKANVLVEVNQ